MCIDAVDNQFRDIGNKDLNYYPNQIAYGKYKANDGVHSMSCNSEQAAYLNKLSRDACLFYLAFTFVDGTNGIANGIAQHIMSYIGIRKSIYSARPSSSSSSE
jgi:hypothetical protein